MVASQDYTAREQTSAQRQALIEMATAWSIAQGAVPGPEAEAVYARYIAGELTLRGVTNELVRYYADRAAEREKAQPAESKNAQPAESKNAQRGEMQPEQVELE